MQCVYVCVFCVYGHICAHVMTLTRVQVSSET